MESIVPSGTDRQDEKIRKLAAEFDRRSERQRARAARYPQNSQFAAAAGGKARGYAEAATTLRSTFKIPQVAADHDCERHSWFDRTICAEPCGDMHYYCGQCGRRLDVCLHDDGGDA